MSSILHSRLRSFRTARQWLTTLVASAGKPFPDPIPLKIEFPTNNLGQGKYGVHFLAALSLASMGAADAPRELPPLGVLPPANPSQVKWELGDPAAANAHRTRWSLDGWWRIQPIGKDAPVGQWAFLKVSAQNQPPKFLDAAGKPLTKMRTAAGAELPVAGFDKFLLEREFTPPADADGSIWVRFGNVEDASRVVFCNGRCVGEIHPWGRGEFNLTPFLVPGANRLAVMLGESVDGETWITINWADKDNISKPTFLNGVWLEKRPKRSVGIHAPMLITSSWRTKEVVVELPLSNSSGAAQDVGFSGVVADPTGTQLARLESPTRLRLEANEAPSRRKIALKWAEPIPWHDTDPRLLTLALQVERDGRVVDTVLPERFGFREVWTEGRDLMMNGHPVHLRGNSHNYMGYPFTPEDIRTKKRLGMNADRTIGLYKTSIAILDASLDVTDEMGHYVTLRFPTVDPDDAAVMTATRKHMTWLTEAAHNHPSFLLRQLWQGSDYTGYMNGPWAHPIQLGEPMSVVAATRSMKVTEGGNHDIGPGDLGLTHENAKPDSDAGRLRRALALVEMYRRIDPSRPTYYYRRGLGSEVRGLMFYWGQATPAQVMAEAPRYWAANGDQPLMFNEVSLLMLGSSKNILGEWFAWQVDRPIPLVVEHSARHLGDEAYRQADDRLVRLMNGTLDDLNQTMQTSQLQAVKASLYKQALRAWRTYGISYLLHAEGKTATMPPAVDGLSEMGRVLQRNNGPFLSYIGGPEEDFVRQDHAFFSGETVRKQIIIRNDLAGSVKSDATWRVSHADTTIAQGRESFEVASGELGVRPISFTAPVVAARENLVLQLDVTAGDIRQSDIFELQVFPRSRGVRDLPTGAIGVMDPVGDTSALLKRAGVPFKDVKAPADLAGLNALILGREFYSRKSAVERAVQLVALDLDRAVANGLNVLVMEQGNDTVMGLRNWQPDAREVFIRAADHPLFAGLANEDLRNWRGPCTIVEPYPRWDDRTDAKTGQPLWMNGDYSKHGRLDAFGRRTFWHWSNNGIVSTYWYEKPQTGNSLVLVDGGFDQYFTPLLEMRSGKGRVLFCQLDVTGRYGADPVATLLVDRMLKHILTPAPAAVRPVAFLGDPQGAAMLTSIGVDVLNVARLAAGDADVYAAIVVCPPATGDALQAVGANLMEYARGGGTVFVASVAGNKSLTWLPLPVTLEDKPVAKTLFESRGLLAGIAPSQLFWRSIRTVPVVTAAPAGSRTTDSGVITEIPTGTGRIILVQVLPDEFNVFPADTVKPKTQEESWNIMLPLLKAKTRQLWQALMSNSGAAFSVGPQVGDVTPIGTTNGRLYPEKALPFDPDTHHTW